MTGPPGHQARPSPPIGQARSPAGQAAQARSAGPAQYRWWPIKGRRLGFEDPNRPLCEPPPPWVAPAAAVATRRRRQATAVAKPPSLLASKSPIPFPLLPLMASTRPGHGGRPTEQGSPSPASFGPLEPSLQAGAWRIRPRRPFRWHSEVRSRLPRGRGRSESGTKRRPCAAD